MQKDMAVENLIENYEAKKKLYGKQAYRYVSDILQKEEAQHKEDFVADDCEQSWNSFKRKNLKKFVQHIIKAEVQNLNLEAVSSDTLATNESSDLSRVLNSVKRNLSVDYGEFGCHIPDIDTVVYDAKTNKVIAVFLCKNTLKEGIIQTGYWKLKLTADEVTKHIKVYFVVLEDDETLTPKDCLILEEDTDGGYILSETEIEERGKVKMFDKFIDDLKVLLK